MATARTIDIYGVENSCTPASDLLTKLTYLGLCCRMHTDAYLQQIAAAHLGVADVAVAFSHSGCSMDTVKALRLARRAGANTIAVTSRKNPLLAKYADVCLYTGGEDTVIYGTAIFSRIPDLAVVDLLYMGTFRATMSGSPAVWTKRSGHCRPRLSGGVRFPGGGFLCNFSTRKAPVFDAFLRFSNGKLNLSRLFCGAGIC